MTGPIWGVRELDIRYKPLRLPLPVRSEIHGPHEAARLAAAVLADVTVEKVIALHLTAKHTLIGVHVVSVGTLTAALVHPRDVFKAAFLANAAGLILCHYVARHISASYVSGGVMWPSRRKLNVLKPFPMKSVT